jgi:hypothetical protein
MRFLVGRPAALSHTFEDDSGEPYVPGSVAVSIVRDGSSTPLTGAATLEGQTFHYTATGLSLGRLHGDMVRRRLRRHGDDRGCRRPPVHGRGASPHR